MGKRLSLRMMTPPFTGRFRIVQFISSEDGEHHLLGAPASLPAFLAEFLWLSAPGDPGSLPPGMAALPVRHVKKRWFIQPCSRL
jgi:hypothetical protein